MKTTTKTMKPRRGLVPNAVPPFVIIIIIVF